MKRVVIVCRGCGEGGSVARVALRHARELSRHFEVALVSDSFPDERQPFPCVRVRARRFGVLRRFAHVPHELSFARAARRAIARMDSVGFAIVHSHVVAARLRDVPFALVTHGDVFDRPAGTYDRLLARLYRHDTPRAYRKASLVLALSPHMADQAVRGGAEEGRVVVVPNGIDATQLGPLATRAGGPLSLLFVGRLAVEKGVEHLIDACARLRIAYRLTIVGDGPLAASLRERAAALGDRVVFRGTVPHHQLGAVYAAADLTCAPSLSEALPGVVLESLSAGTPVLASDIGPHRFLIEHGRNGLLVPAGDPVALADVIQSLDRDTLARLAANTRASVEPFSWPAIGDRIAELIRPFVA